MKQAMLEAEDDAIYRSYIPFVAFQWYACVNSAGSTGSRFLKSLPIANRKPNDHESTHYATNHSRNMGPLRRTRSSKGTGC